jgi:hypothetical protein
MASTGQNMQKVSFFKKTVVNRYAYHMLSIQNMQKQSHFLKRRL